LFKWAPAFAVEIAVGSTSIPTTRRAPKHLAARARIPLPVPRSTTNFYSLPRVNSSSKRSNIAVVACSPGPKAAPAGTIKLWGKLPASRFVGERTTISRFPIRSGLGFSLCANRFIQSRRNFLARPPNSWTSLRDSFRDVHAISICTCFRPGRAMIASAPRASACNLSSRALSQHGPAVFRHRYINSSGATRCVSSKLRCRSYFFPGAFSSFICAIFWARPAANFSYWTLSMVKVPNM
jgi:hypothetical protein